MEPTSTEQIRNQYMNTDRSVNIQQNLKQQKESSESGLDGVEIRQGAKNLGKDDFLKLLITQLSHQDPTQPVTDQAFIAQMAQFSSLEQMQNIATGIAKMSERQAYSMVGKFVIGKDFATGEMTSGIAKALFYDNAGQAFLKVGGRAVALADITLVGDASDFKPEVGGLGEANTSKPEGQKNQTIDTENHQVLTKNTDSSKETVKTEINSSQEKQKEDQPKINDENNRNSKNSKNENQEADKPTIEKINTRMNIELERNYGYMDFASNRNYSV